MEKSDVKPLSPNSVGRIAAMYRTIEDAFISAKAPFIPQQIWNKTIVFFAMELPFTRASFLVEFNQLTPEDRTTLVTFEWSSNAYGEINFIMFLSIANEKELMTSLLPYYSPDVKFFPSALNYSLVHKGFCVGIPAILARFSELGYSIPTRQENYRGVRLSIISSVIQGGEGRVRELFSYFPETNLNCLITDIPPHTPLSLACQLKAVGTMKLLLEHGASPTCNGWTIFRSLCDIIGVFSKPKAHYDLKVDFKASDKAPAVVLEIIKLLDTCDDFFAKVSIDCVFLVVWFLLAIGQQTYCLKLIALYNWLEMNDGRASLLIYACERSSRKLVKFLLDHGADPNTAVGHGYCPLLAAARRNQTHGLAIAKLLIENGAHVHAAIESDGASFLVLAHGRNWNILFQNFLATYNTTLTMDLSSHSTNFSPSFFEKPQGREVFSFTN
jgi:ankyrin repeat protein